MWHLSPSAASCWMLVIEDLESRNAPGSREKL
jgi:hypothetical protein